MSRILLALMTTTIVINGSSLAQGSEKAAVKYVTGLESTPVRLKPSFFSAVGGSLPYGSSVQVLQKKAGWAQVSSGGLTGWIQVAAFTRQDGVLREIGRGHAATENGYKDDVMAAGKGFSPEFEAKYKKENPTANFGAVDQLESRKIDPADLLKFANEGNLRGSAVVADSAVPQGSGGKK